MKSYPQQVTWAHRVWSTSPISANESSFVRRVVSAPAHESDGYRRLTNNNQLGALGLVRILAFCQALLFLTLFLLICTWAGAATESKRVFNPEISKSVYSPVSVRDPFGSGGAKSVSASDGERTRVVGPSLLKLKGILYHTVHPSAIVNDQLVELNKSVMVQTEQGPVEIKALQMTREVVLLEVGGQKVELRLGGGEHE
jgi:hypothetical protein